MTIGVAAFVKTPGVTPLKTRLAESIGTEKAEEFYLLSCRAISAVLTSISTEAEKFSYWAIADSSDITQKYWNEFDQLSQGDGGLGSRLYNVYSSLKENHEVGILIGSDCPQLSFADLQCAIDLVFEDNHAVIGPAADGGFYLFAAKCDLERELWESVEYSSKTTCEMLIALLEKSGIKVAVMKPLTDVDTEADLKAVVRELQQLRNPLPEQVDVLKWCLDDV